VEEIIAAAQDYDHSDGLTAGNPDAEKTVLVGDSTMGQYIPRVRELIEQHAIDLNRNRIVVDLQAGCPPIPDIASDQFRLCAQFVDKVLPMLDDEKVKTVALAAFWTTELTTAQYFLRSDKPKVFLPDSETARDRAIGYFAALISHLVSNGKRVFVLLETPSSEAYDPETMLPTGWHRLLGYPKISESPKRSEIEKFVGRISDEIQRAAEAAGARVIRPLDYLCDNDSCPIRAQDGHLIYFNYDHLRRSYVRDHATYIDQIFLPDVDNAGPPDGPSAR
jgi:hypothetical protein